MRVKKITVKPGDTLWSLAEDHMKDGKRWRDLFLINASTLVFEGRPPEKVGPDFIFPGEQLFVITDVEFEPSGN